MSGKNVSSISSFGCVSRGYSHILHGKECQDSFKSINLSDGSKVIAVADGHGSCSCPFSKSGSVIAVNVFCHLVSNIYANCNERAELTIDFLHKNGEIQFAKLYEREWKRRVIKVHKAAKRIVQLREDGTINEEAIYHMYGTTILGLFVCTQYIFAFQIGDGNISIYNSNRCNQLLQTERLLGTETYSLCQNNAWRHSHVHIEAVDGNELPYILLCSSDGFINSFLNEKEYLTACKGYCDSILEYGEDKVKKSMKKWLRDTGQFGSGDDITLAYVIIFRVKQ